MERKGCRSLSTLSGGALGLYASGSRARRKAFHFELPLFYFYGLGVGEEKRVPAGLTVSGGAFGMHVSGSGRRLSSTLLVFLLYPFNFSRTGWGRRERGAGGSYCWR